MNIGIIGTGNVGTGIGKRLAAKGHQILVSFARRDTMFKGIDLVFIKVKLNVHVAHTA